MTEKNNMTENTDSTDKVEREVKPFDLRLHVHRLLIDEPFFAALSRRIDKRAGGVPTAGVRVTEEGKLEMRYNPDFFAPLSDETRKDILKHEFYHIVLQHVTGGRFRSFRDMSPAECRQHNIAMDLAINSHLDNLPEGCCKPGQDGPFKALPAHKSAEWYLKNLPEQEGGEGGGSGPEGGGSGPEGQGGDGEGQPGDGQGQGQGNAPFEDGVFDDHSGWGDVDDATKQLAEERVKDFIREAVNEAQKSSRGWGTVPGNMRKDILDSITSKLDWKKVLRYFVKQSQKANKRSTVRKINRRYPYQHPGKKATRAAKVAIAIDQSGSVSDQMLEAFFGELNGLSKLAEFTVVPFDTRVDDDKVYVWKKGQKRKRERVMCGGTCFDAPTKWVNEKGGFDGLIVLTDMEAPKPIACRVQRMWMTTDYHANRPYFDPKPERLVGIPLE